MGPAPSTRVWLYRAPADMRKSFDGLAALARQGLGEEPSGGALFVFVNRRRTLMKALYFEGDGWCVWAKRLERGCFQVDFGAPLKRALSWHEWRFIVEGVDLDSVRHLPRYRHAQTLAS